MTKAPDINSGPLLYWRIMRALNAAYGHFHSRTVVDIVGDRHRKGIERYLTFLLAERVVRIRPDSRETGARAYELLRDGEAPPERRTTGGLGTRQQLLWTAMRTLKQFSAAELAVAASTDDIVIPRETAASYISDLVKAGYLATIGPATQKPTVPFYRLLASHNSGPRAPIVLRGEAAAYDLNIMSRVSGAVNPNALRRAA